MHARPAWQSPVLAHDSPALLSVRGVSSVLSSPPQLATRPPNRITVREQNHVKLFIHSPLILVTSVGTLCRRSHWGATAGPLLGRRSRDDALLRFLRSAFAVLPP